MTFDRSRSSSSPLSSLPSSRSSSPDEDEEDQDQASGPLFYVERIIARSICTYPLRRGREEEHRYLVRWWGYTPNDDSWEPKSELAKTAKEMIEAFDADHHPFTILDRQGAEQGKVNKVRYGYSSRLTGFSPKAEVVWHTAAQIVNMGISPEGLANAESAWELGLAPTPRISWSKPAKTNRPQPQVSRGRPGYKLLRFVDEERLRGKGRVLVEFKIRKGNARQQWYSRAYLTTVFGREAVRIAREEWTKLKMAAMEEGTDEQVGSDSVVVPVNEYEAARKRNIDENQELMRSLGLGVGLDVKPSI